MSRIARSSSLPRTGATLALPAALCLLTAWVTAHKLPRLAQSERIPRQLSFSVLCPTEVLCLFEPACGALVERKQLLDFISKQDDG